MSHTVYRAVVLAAGRGKRMMPLTANRPKPLIPIAGRPILEHILRGLQQAGIRETLVIHGYLGSMIEEYFGAGERIGMSLCYRKQDPPDGTGGALRQATDFCGDLPFVLHWGDILVSPWNYPAILDTYRKSPISPACIMGLNWVEDPWAGAAVYREDNRVVRVIEKPAPGTSTTQWNAGGVKVIGPEVWKYIPQLTPSPRGEYEFTDVFRLLIENHELIIGHELTGLWSDVGTPEIVEALDNDPRLAEWGLIEQNTRV